MNAMKCAASKVRSFINYLIKIEHYPVKSFSVRAGFVSAELLLNAKRFLIRVGRATERGKLR